MSKSERSYYLDAYTYQFQANLLEVVRENGRFALILDHTYFYPTSGGQPFDTGTINGLPVTDVSIRESDDAICHWIADTPPTNPQLSAKINWERRFDHMQQHSGQHILSQAFWRVADAATESFHLSDQSVTIDLDKDTLSEDHLLQAEQLANQIVWENRPIQVRMVAANEVKALSLRKVPPGNHNQLRLVEIQDFDITACGGTHVGAAGAVGMVKIVKSERRRGNLRIEFCCGGRAYRDYQQKHLIISQLASAFTTGIAELPDSMEKLRTENKELQRTLKKQQAALLEHQAQALYQQAERHGEIAIITYVHDGPAAELRPLAQQLISYPATAAFLGLTGSKTNLLFACSADIAKDMRQLLVEAFQFLGNGSGGGGRQIAQGGGTAVSLEHLTAALHHAKEQLIKSEF